MSILFRFDNTEVRKRNFFTCVAIPAWSQPGTQSTLWPCILLLNGLNKAEYGARLINRSYSSITIRAKKQKCKKKGATFRICFWHLPSNQSIFYCDSQSMAQMQSPCHVWWWDTQREVLIHSMRKLLSVLKRRKRYVVHATT